ncbi:hypothetical protein [Actinocorallia libanotica]|uniref:Uncharacterized protein n=1 Tax=Actinocorallia libanotica TaxID=46162 RepID=A0ABN1RRV2_9ACTN
MMVGMRLPGLRLSTESDFSYDEPPVSLLRLLVEDVVNRDEDYFIVEWMHDPDGQTFIQVARDSQGLVVEYRQGDVRSHFQAISNDMSLVAETIVGWAERRPGWERGLRWRRWRP